MLSISLVNVDRHFKMLPAYYLYVNCGKFCKETHELEINKKRSLEAWDNKNRKGDIGIWRHERHETRKVQKHVNNESTESTKYMNHEARETREHARHEAREARRYAEH